MLAKYRNLFLRSSLGKDVLWDILSECHFGCTLDPDNKVQVSEYNVGVMILNNLGIFSEDTGRDVIKALANVSPKETE